MCRPTPTNAAFRRCNTAPAKLGPIARKIKKRVRFGGVAEIEAQDIHHFDESQAESMWFTPQDLKAIRKDIRRAIRKSHDKESLRGLEFIVNEQRKLDMRDKILDILDQQAYNLLVGKELAEGIMLLSASLSRGDIQLSLQQAAEDAREANMV